MKVSGYILAGGKSSRMGSDKGLLLIQSKPFVSYIFEALSNVCDSITVVTSNKEYNKLGFKTIQDSIPNKGPVGGLFTVLNYLRIIAMDDFKSQIGGSNYFISK
jgi:molybdopterin-guanine dinucleotide biosynthesis protein A